MSVRGVLDAWVHMEARQPALHRAGVGVLFVLALLVPAMEAHQLPAPPQPWLGLLLAWLIVCGLVFGRRMFWNDGERRLRTLWRFVAFAILATIVGRSVAAIGLLPSGSRLAASSASLFVMLGLGRLLISSLATALATRFIDRRPVAELGVVPTRAFGADLGFGLLLGVLLMSGIFCVELALGWVQIKDGLRSFDPGHSFGAALWRVLVAFVCIGIDEELVTRGYLLRNLAQGFVTRRLPPAAAMTLAVIVSSALFGLGHAGNPNATLVSSLGIACAGVLLALPYVLTGRLGVSIGLHITWNFFQGSFYGFPVSGNDVAASAIVLEQGGPTLWTGGAFGPEAGLLGLIAYLVGCGAIALREHWNHGRVAFCNALVVPASPPPRSPEPDPVAQPSAPQIA